jgi:hypothetical protein
VDDQIGGYADIRDAIAAASVDIDPQRMSDGVVAFGRGSRLTSDGADAWRAYAA